MTKSGKLLAALVVVIVIGGSSVFMYWRPGHLTEPGSLSEGGSSGQINARGNEGPPSNSLLKSDVDGEKTFEQIKIEAEHGSARAQRKLSEIYALCAGYSLDPAKQLATLDSLAALVPGSKSGMDGVKQRLKARCDKVDLGQPIPTEAIDLWMDQAAKNGDLASKIKLRTRSTQPLTAEEASALLDETLTTKDPDAMLEMSNLMSRSLVGELPGRFQQIAGDPTVGAAWGIAACRSGASCGSGSMIMDSVCISTGRCSYRNYEDFLTSEVVSPAERARLNLTASSILRMGAH